MKVGIDTFGCAHGRSGLGSYLMSLLPHLSEDDGITYELFGSEVDRYTYTSKRAMDYVAVNIPESLPAERLWHQFRLNSFGRRQKYDAILYTAGSRMLPNRFKIPGVALVNDVVSNLFETSDDRWLRRQIKRGLSKCQCIITSSNYIKKDLECSGIDCSRVEVIHNGIDHSVFYPAEPMALEADVIDIKPFAIKRPYLIYASRMQNAEKKHIELINAFADFKKKTGLPHRLVIAGSEDKYGEQVHKAAFSSPVASDIFITGYFPHEHFPELYRNADACIFPSVTEGVGLSVLEAMASGLPVACSGAGGLPEIAGDNALFFDSDNISDFSAKIEQVVTDKELRQKLIKGGIEWSKQYSWENTARETEKILKTITQE